MALPLWYAVQRYLYNNLKSFGADANALDPTRVLRKKKSKGRPKKMVSLFTEYSLYHARIIDITKICELRN